MDDPYKILGVDKSASQDDIRRAYRKHAKSLHPDLNPGKPELEAKFKEVSAAYKLLSDPEQRARYDRGEIDATGAERAQHTFYRRYADSGAGAKYFNEEAFGDFDDLSSIFSRAFGRGRRGGGFETFVRARGADVRASLEVDFLEAANGAKKRVTLPNGNTIDVTIPAGIADGQTLRLKGQGMAGAGGGKSGDVLVEVRVRPHPYFTRRDNDIHLELPVSLSEAVLGAKVEVPTIAGRVSLAIPKGSNSGKRLRIKGKGVADRRTGKRGDQYVTLKVMLPERPDPELEAFVERWAKTHAYDPRRNMTGAA